MFVKELPTRFSKFPHSNDMFSMNESWSVLGAKREQAAGDVGVYVGLCEDCGYYL